MTTTTMLLIIVFMFVLPYLYAVFNRQAQAERVRK